MLARLAESAGDAAALREIRARERCLGDNVRPARVGKGGAPVAAADERRSPTAPPAPRADDDERAQLLDAAAPKALAGAARGAPPRARRGGALAQTLRVLRPSLRAQTLALAWCWFTVTLVYYGQ